VALKLSITLKSQKSLRAAQNVLAGRVFETPALQCNWPFEVISLFVLNPNTQTFSLHWAKDDISLWQVGDLRLSMHT